MVKPKQYSSTTRFDSLSLFDDLFEWLSWWSPIHSLSLMCMSLPALFSQSMVYSKKSAIDVCGLHG